MLRWSWVCVAILGLVIARVAMAGGKLESVRSEVRGDSGGSSSSSSSGWGSSSSSGGSGWSWSWGDDDDDHDYDWNADTSFSAGTNSSCCVADDLFPPDVPRYTRYPYADGQEGHIERVPREKKDERGRMFSGRAVVEGGYAGDHVWRSGFSLRLSYWRLGFDNDLHFFLEQPVVDALYLGTSNVTFDIVQQPGGQWRVGTGLIYMIDGRTPGEGHREYAAGPNVTTSIDAFPVKPMVLSGRFDYGRLYKADVFTARLTLGVMLKRVELFGGYEYKAIGKVALHGPIAGVRVWF